MRYFALIILLSCTLQSFSITRRFIRKIDKVELKYDQQATWRGNDLYISLDVVLNDGTSHSCETSKKIDHKDFNILVTGNGKLVKRKKRYIHIRFDKNLTSKKVNIQASLRKDDKHVYLYEIPVIDHRETVGAVAIISNKNKIYPNSSFQINIQSFYNEGLSSTTLGDAPKKLFKEDFTYEVSGAGKLLNNTGKVYVYNEFDKMNNDIKITARLKTNPAISITKTYTKHFNTNSWNTFSAQNGRDGDDACISTSQLNGRDGKRYTSKILDGQNGEHALNGRNGGQGQRGADGENLNVFVSIADSLINQNVILKIEIKSNSGETKTRYIGSKGTLKIYARGGNGGDGGDGSRGGDGGDGGSGGKYEDEEVVIEGVGGHGGNGGHGGFGGVGGDGGTGGDVIIYYTPQAKHYLNVLTIVNTGGSAGRGGDGGYAGRHGDGAYGPGGSGEDGRNGERGIDGPSGHSGSNGIIDYIQL